MTIIDYAQFGVAIFSVAALAYVVTFIVKRFLDFLKAQEISFTEIITNHLAESNKILSENTQSAIKLKNAIYNLMKWLNKNNK